MKSAAICLVALLGASTAACVTAPPVPPPVATASSATQFVELATVSNTFEIETSQVALERATQPEVRRFAQRMIADHTMATRRMAQVLRRNGMEAPPPSLDARHAAMLEQLKAAPAEGFDAAYMTMQAQAHEEAVTLFSSYADSGDNPTLRRFAAQTLPTLQGHARMVQQITGQAHSM
jgi:putative membrane protein